jgi:hypothetical protein
MTCNGDCNQGRECNCERKMKQHKWHKEIKAWADGAEIEYSSDGNNWYSILCIEWNEQSYYRIKQQPKQPKYLYVYQDVGKLVLEESNCIVTNMKCIGKIEVRDD